VGFFDDLTPRGQAEPEPMPPPWTSAPDGWIGGVVPAELAIGRSEEAAVVLSRIVAYPIGFELTLDAHCARTWCPACRRPPGS
jgi:hypothetical protein